MKHIIIITISVIIFSLYQYNSYSSSFLKVENISTSTDIDNDGINDIDDIVEGAKAEVKNKTNYKSGYYSGGYPPENEGVCTDVVWRALSNAGIDFKGLVDSDINNNLSKYTRVDGKADTNIDFRRVPNLKVFLDRKAISLTTDIIPGDINNLAEWQAGDIVIFGKPKDHIAIISDRRNIDGVPYMIHNSAPTPREDDWLIYWDKNISPIIGHYRWKY